MRLLYKAFVHRAGAGGAGELGRSGQLGGSWMGACAQGLRMGERGRDSLQDTGRDFVTMGRVFGGAVVGEQVQRAALAETRS